MQARDNKAIEEPDGYDAVIVELDLVPWDDVAAPDDESLNDRKVGGWGQRLSSRWQGVGDWTAREFRSREPFRVPLPGGTGGSSRFFVPGLELLQSRFVVDDGRTQSIEYESELLAAKSVGLALFSAVLPDDDAIQSWRDRVERADDGGRGVRLMLNLVAADLEAVPWELLNDGGSEGPCGGGFLALDPSISIVRRGVGGNEVVARDPKRFKVFLAHVGGMRLFEKDARDRPTPTLPSWKDPRRQLGLDLEVISGASLGERVSIDHMWRDFDRSEGTTVFHFTGHGADGDETREPYLLFPKEGDIAVVGAVEAQPLYVHELKSKLAPDEGAPSRRGVELAVIAACDVGSGHWWSGFGARLLEAGVPAVVTMQAPTEDGAAEVFGAALYAALTAGKTVDAAVSAGRRAVAETSTYKDWWLPLLHTHSDVRFEVGTGSSDVPEEVPPPTLFRNGSDGRPEALPSTGVGERRPVLTPDGRWCVEAWDGVVRVGLVDPTGQVRDWTEYDAPSGLERLLAAKVNYLSTQLLAVIDGSTELVLVDGGEARDRQRLDPSPATSGLEVNGGFMWVVGGRLGRTGPIPRLLPDEGAVAIDVAVGTRTWLVAGIVRDELILQWGRLAETQSVPSRFPLDGSASAVAVVRPTDQHPEPRHVMVWHGGRWECFDRSGRAVG